MKSVERVLSALYLEESDRVPHFEMGICNEVLSEIFHKTPSFFNDPLRKIQAYKNLGVDGSLDLHFGQEEGYATPYIVLDKNLFVDKGGRVFSRTHSYSAIPTESEKGIMKPFYVGGYLTTPEKFEEFNAQVYKDQDEDWKDRCASSYRRARKTAKDDFFVTPVVGGILEGTITSIGHTNFFRYLFEKPRFIHTILEDRKKHAIEKAKIFLGEGAKGVALFDDYGDKHGPQMSPKYWLRFIYPRLKEITNTCHRRGAFCILHSCGNIEPLISFIIDAGIDAIQSLEPTAGISIGRIKQAYGERVCLIGNLDFNIIGLGTANQVNKLVEHTILEAASGGGFMLGATHEIYPITKDLGSLSQRFLSIIDSVNRYGVYSSIH